MQRKLILLITVFLLLFANVVLAQNENFSIDKSYKWLISQQDATGCFSKGNCNIEKTALATLALNKGGYATNAEDAAVWLLGQQDPVGCFPKGTCNIKDTSLAILALNKANKDTTKLTEWLTTAEQAASTGGGNWWLQIIADSGTCTISYTGLTTPQTITITGGKFIDCNNNYWFDLRECVTGTPLKTKPSQKFSIDCSAIGNPKTSLIYNSGNKYYLLKESTGSIEVNVDNGCWGSTKTTACSYEPTWYASYALKESGKDVSSMIWLRDNYQTNDILYNTFMSLLTDRTVYLEALKNLQQEGGSFGNNVQQTALVLLALSKTSSLSSYTEVNTKAINWLKAKQEIDGSWNKDVLDTTYVLYGLQITPTGESICGDGYCDFSESESNCPKDCKPTIGAPDIEVCDDYIDNDGDGDVDCEDMDCFYDIMCEEVPGVTIEEPEEINCEDEIDNDDDGDVDCEDIDCSEDPACEKGNLFGWLLFIIIVVLLIVVGYFFAKKGVFRSFKDRIISLFKKKPKKPVMPTPTKRPLPSFRPQAVSRPIIKPRTQPKKRKGEDELTKSIEEARKLMGLK